MLHLSSTYILVNDIDRSSEFYSKLLGAKPTVITPDRWLQFDIDGNSFAICNQLFDFKTIVGGDDLDALYSKAYIKRLSKHKTVFGNNIIHKFQTDDLSKEHSRISAIHGGIVSDILYTNITSPYSFFTVTDPDGNLIEIFGEYDAPKQLDVTVKDKENQLRAVVTDKAPVVEPVVNKPAAVTPVSERPVFVKPVPEKPVPVLRAPEKPVVAAPIPEKPVFVKPEPVKTTPVPEKPVFVKPEPVKPVQVVQVVPVVPVPEKPVVVAPVPEKPVAVAPEPEPEIPVTVPPINEKTFKDKSILKAAIEKEKETKAIISAPELPENESDDQSGNEPVFITPNWEEIADRLKNTVIEKTVRPGSAVKEKEPRHVKQADTEPVKKVMDRPALRPIVAEEKSLVLEEQTDDSPAVMTPIWDEAYVKSKAPAFDKTSLPTSTTTETEHKLDKRVEDTQPKQSLVSQNKLIGTVILEMEEPAVLPAIVAKNIRHAAAVKEPETKPEKQPTEKPIFKPLAKEKEKEKEKEKAPEKVQRPVEEEAEDKPVPFKPPIWEQPTADLWGDERK